MLTEVQNDILKALDDIPTFKERGVWQGDLEDLMKTAQKLPSAHVVLASGLSQESRTIPPKTAPTKLSWDVIVAYECLRDRRISADEGYGLIETVINKIRGLKSQGGQLWLESFDLLNTVNGKTAYAIRFAIEREL